MLRHGAAVPRIINSLNEPQDAKNLVDTQMRSRHGRGYILMGVSEKSWGYPQIIHFHGIFHSIHVRVPLFMKPAL